MLTFFAAQIVTWTPLVAYVLRRKSKELYRYGKFWMWRILNMFHTNKLKALKLHIFDTFSDLYFSFQWSSAVIYPKNSVNLQKTAYFRNWMFYYTLSGSSKRNKGSTFLISNFWGLYWQARGTYYWNEQYEYFKPRKSRVLTTKWLMFWLIFLQVPVRGTMWTGMLSCRGAPYASWWLWPCSTC